MRKFILLSVAALVLSLTACNGGSGEKNTESKTEEQIEKSESSGEGDEDLVISPDTEELEPAEEKTLEKLFRIFTRDKKYGIIIKNGNEEFL